MTSFCILNKSVYGSAISNKPAGLGTIHQNLKFKAIKQCDFKRVVQYCRPDSSRIPLPSIGKL